MRILITGVSGMLGATLANMLEEEHEVYGTGNSNFDERPKNYKVLDLNSNNYQDIIKWSKPEIIVLSGALTNGNYCNNNPDKAFSVNGISVKKFAEATDANVKFIYISTDAVFPSALHLAKESDCVSPENVYGKSKELGEFFAKLSDREFCIIRTTIVGLNINSKKSGFVEWIINASKTAEDISLFDDVLFNPISIWELGNEIKHIVSLKDFPNEILHISGTEIVTKYKFGIELLKHLNLDTTTIKSGLISSFKDRAKRCNDQTLSCDYYQEKYNRKLPKLSDTLQSINQYYEAD
ncbi:NAD(P)-dependent oxidoreductase [Winogradskyella litoriviva]|uniref:dTDP-4-dehydrorhamnose reductase n=1 Tax=Winogradskyella litoriviva TaxID=1220182 RepID=A0ABX2E215_9FLAO|nr:sugar nucleotide-binding protein [Winogradskyella litoriviva]NRD22162.1 NAD(P)-dependent oxidoreductase [Winogradskyella litoriviva]